MSRSVLCSAISRYLELKQALGRSYAIEQQVLFALDRFLADTPAADLTAETFACWCNTQHHLTSGVLRNRMRIVRNFCLYRQRTEPDCFIPDNHLFPTPHQPIKPYRFTEADIVDLLQTAATLKPSSRSPLRPVVFRLAVVLLYTTGMRRGELARLTLGDYDPVRQALCVRASKFHKSRDLPLSPDTDRELNAYFDARRQHRLSMALAAPLLWNGYGPGYTGSGLWQGMRQLFRLAGVRNPEGRLPRTHDMRHAFAVNALLRWYRAGVDVQTKLPLLATYMGHVSIASTQYYLPFGEDLAAASSARFAACCGDLVAPLTNPIGGDQ